MSPLPNRVRRLRIGQRFAVVVAGLLVVMTGLVAVATTGIRQVNKGATDIDRELRTVELVNGLALQLAHAEQATLRLIPANNRERQDQLNAVLDESTIRLASSIAALRAAVVDEAPEEAAAVDEIERRWKEFLDLRRDGELDVIGTGPDVSALNERLADDVVAIFGPATEAIRGLLEHEVAEGKEARGTAQSVYSATLLRLLALFVGAGVFAAGLLWWLIRSVVPRVRAYAGFAVDVAEGKVSGRLQVSGFDELAELGRALDAMVQQQLAHRDDERAQNEYGQALQSADDEGEAHELLRRHLERAISGTSVVVLNRNNSADRLEALTDLGEQSVLRGTLPGASPRSCLALRLVRAQPQGNGCDSLASCQLCEGTAGWSLCEPLLVGGEVIGSVLVERSSAFDADARRTIHHSVAQAAPVLANLRNLALSEVRANNDALTGLPNRRASEETIKRMVAQANRVGTPLALCLLDLDHFKQINDTYGHDVGDDVLAAAAVALRHRLRETDFVGRFGGEEFLLALPETGPDDARSVFEAVREAVANAVVRGVDRPVTASLGVAVLPDDASDYSSLLRLADRLLYSAKAKGRDRVETSAPSPRDSADFVAHEDRPRDQAPSGAGDGEGLPHSLRHSSSKNLSAS